MGTRGLEILGLVGLLAVAGAGLAAGVYSLRRIRRGASPLRLFSLLLVNAGCAGVCVGCLAGIVWVGRVRAESAGRIADERLLASLGDSDPAVRARAVRGIGAKGLREQAPALVRALGDPDPEVRAGAAEALGILECADVSACHGLCLLLSDRNESVRTAAGEALRRVPSASADHVAGFLASADPAIRAIGLAAAREMGPAYVRLWSRMIASTRDTDPGVRAAALEAIAGHGYVGSPEEVAAAEGGLMDADPRVRWIAVWAVQELVPDAASKLPGFLDARTSALPGILAACADANDLRRYRALRLLAKVRGPASQVMPVLVSALEHPDPRTEDLAFTALRAYGAEAAPAIEPLVEMLGDPRRRAAAEGVLWSIGAPAVGPLVAVVGDPGTGEAAEAMLVALGWPAVRPLLDVLGDLARPGPAREAARRVLAAIHGTDPEGYEKAFGPLPGAEVDRR